jgi:hypothetical protein
MPVLQDLQQGLSQLCFCVAADVEGNGAAVDGARELLSWQVGRTNVRSILDVAKPHRIRCRAEVEGAAKEDAVHRSDDWSTIGGDGRQGQQAHTGQAVGDLGGGRMPLRGDDAEQGAARQSRSCGRVGLAARWGQPASRAREQ